MRKLLALTAIATTVAVAACATSSATPPATTTPPATQPPVGTISANAPAGAVATWRASLQSSNGSSVSGMATVAPSPGGSLATVNIESATPGAVHPWHVHNGTCLSGGGVVGPASAYDTPLTVSGGGRARATAQLPLTLDPSQSYHVNVHQSSSDMGTIVACGDLHIVKS